MQKYTKEYIRNFVFLIWKTFGSYPERSGGCYKFHLILKHIFNGEGYYNGEHIITKIGDYYWDIDGEVTDTEGYLNIIEHVGYDLLNAQFKQHL